MIAVIFEAIPNINKLEDYLSMAEVLKPELQKIEGFISIERFQSLTYPTKVLSLSFWENEKSVLEWRNFEQHQVAQRIGKETIFKSYRIRVGEIDRDYGMEVKALDASLRTK